MFKKVSSSIAHAALFQLGSKLINVIIQLAITMILARILSPEEYGVVAILIVFTGFFSILSDIGISSAIIQFQDLTDKDYRHLFTFTIVLGLLLSAVFYIVCVGLVYLYDNELYYSLGAILTLSVLFNAMNMVPNGLLLRDRRFDLVGVRLIVCTVIVGVITVFLAYAGFSYYALVINSVLTAFFVLLWNITHLRIKPLSGDFRPSLKKIWRYSVFQFGHEVLGYFARNLDSLIAGKFFGAAALGYYDKAYRLYGYPQTYLMSSIASTLRPFFALHQSEVKIMYEKLRKVAKTVSLLAAFCSCVICVSSYELIAILFGAQWIDAAPLLQVLSLSIYAQSMNTVLAPVMGATGRTDYLMLCTTINSLITIAMIVVGASLGTLYTMAVFVTVAYNLEVSLPLYYAIKKCLNESIQKYIRAFIPEIVAFIFVVWVGYTLKDWSSVALIALTEKVLFCTFAYGVLCLLLGQGRYFKSALYSIKGKRTRL